MSAGALKIEDREKCLNLYSGESDDENDLKSFIQENLQVKTMKL